jgi:hypothetical protein
MQLSLRSRTCVCCWAALFIPGCSRPALTSDQTAALTAGEERWKRSGVRDYCFEIHPFAPLSFGQDAGKIEVRGGVVKSVTRLGSLEPPRATVDELFASIREASRSGRYAKIEAVYDAKLGYPSRVVFTANKDIRDGNSIVEITALEDLRIRRDGAGQLDHDLPSVQ